MEGYREGFGEEFGDPSLEGQHPIRGIAGHWYLKEEISISELDIFEDGRARKGRRVSDSVTLDLRGRSLHLF